MLPSFIPPTTTTSLFSQSRVSRTNCTRIVTPRTSRRHSTPKWRASTQNVSRKTPTIGVLMVCLGNICRSPAAEAVLRERAAIRGLSDIVRVDSCGTGGGSEFWYMKDGFSFHEGDPSDKRMRRTAEARGIEITSTSRPLRPSDFADFRYIIAMDDSNVDGIETAAEHWNVKRGDSRVVKLMDFTKIDGKKGMAVPDPYYGGVKGFENALDLIQEACDGLLDAIEMEIKLEV